MFDPCPYPRAPSGAFEDHWRLRNGARCTLRPVQPQDAALMGALFAQLSPASRRMRCHCAVNGLGPRALAYMSKVDQHSHVACVITTVLAGREHILADARYVRDPEGASAEFALVVHDDWRRLGLGTRAMQALAGRAHDGGLRWLHGRVLAGNQPMLGLMRHCRFACSPDPEDDGLVVVEARADLVAGSGGASGRLAGASAGRGPGAMRAPSRVRGWLVHLSGLSPFALH